MSRPAWLLVANVCDQIIGITSDVVEELPAKPGTVLRALPALHP